MAQARTILSILAFISLVTAFPAASARGLDDCPDVEPCLDGLSEGIAPGKNGMIGDLHAIFASTYHGIVNGADCGKNLNVDCGLDQVQRGPKGAPGNAESFVGHFHAFVGFFTSLLGLP